MASNPTKDLAPLHTFTFADGRHSKKPRQTKHPHYCSFHSTKKTAIAISPKRTSSEMIGGLPADYVSSVGVSATLARLFRGVSTCSVDPEKARTLAYIAQIVLQAIPDAEREFSLAFGTHTLPSVLSQAFGHLNREFVDSYKRLRFGPKAPPRPIRATNPSTGPSSNLCGSNPYEQWTEGVPLRWGFLVTHWSAYR